MPKTEELKNGTENINEEQQANNPAPETPEEKKDGKIKSFFKKHGTKIRNGAIVVGAVAAGVAADRLGLKIGGGKKKDDDPASEPEA